MLNALSLARAGYGTVLLCAPGTVIGVCTGHPAGPGARAVARVLGVRHLIQAALTASAPDSRTLGVGAQVDLAHAASMLALGAARRPVRRAPLADALVATVFAALARGIIAKPRRDGAKTAGLGLLRRPRVAVGREFGSVSEESR